jgi:hypothetical protein
MGLKIVSEHFEKNDPNNPNNPNNQTKSLPQLIIDPPILIPMTLYSYITKSLNENCHRNEMLNIFNKTSQNNLTNFENKSANFDDNFQNLTKSPLPPATLLSTLSHNDNNIYNSTLSSPLYSYLDTLYSQNQNQNQNDGKKDPKNNSLNNSTNAINSHQTTLQSQLNCQFDLLSHFFVPILPLDHNNDQNDQHDQKNYQKFPNSHFVQQFEKNFEKNNHSTLNTIQQIPKPPSIRSSLSTLLETITGHPYYNHQLFQFVLQSEPIIIQSIPVGIFFDENNVENNITNFKIDKLIQFISQLSAMVCQSQSMVNSNIGLATPSIHFQHNYQNMAQIVDNNMQNGQNIRQRRQTDQNHSNFHKFQHFEDQDDDNFFNDMLDIVIDDTNADFNLQTQMAFGNGQNTQNQTENSQNNPICPFLSNFSTLFALTNHVKTLPKGLPILYSIISDYSTSVYCSTPLYTPLFNQNKTAQISTLLSFTSFPHIYESISPQQRQTSQSTIVNVLNSSNDAIDRGHHSANLAIKNALSPNHVIDTNSSPNCTFYDFMIDTRLISLDLFLSQILNNQNDQFFIFTSLHSYIKTLSDSLKQHSNAFINQSVFPGVFTITVYIENESSSNLDQKNKNQDSIQKQSLETILRFVPLLYTLTRSLPLVSIWLNTAINQLFE